MKKKLNTILLTMYSAFIAICVGCSDINEMPAQEYNGCIKIQGRIDTDFALPYGLQESRGTYIGPQKGELGDGSLVKYVTYIIYQDGKVVYDSRTSSDPVCNYQNGKFEIQIDRPEVGGDMYIFAWADAYGNSPESPYTIDANLQTVKADYYKSIGTYDMADAFACYKKIYDAATGEISGDIKLKRPFTRFVILSNDLRNKIDEEDDDFRTGLLTEGEDEHFYRNFETSFFFCPSSMARCSSLESTLQGSSMITCAGDMLDCDICMLPDTWNFTTGEITMNKYGLIIEGGGYDEEGFPLPETVKQTYRLPSCSPYPIEDNEKQPYIIGAGFSGPLATEWAICYMAYLFAIPDDNDQGLGKEIFIPSNEYDDFVDKELPRMFYFLSDKIKWPQEVYDGYSEVTEPTMEMVISRRAECYLNKENKITGIGSQPTASFAGIFRMPYCVTDDLVGGFWRIDPYNGGYLYGGYEFFKQRIDNIIGLDSKFGNFATIQIYSKNGLSNLESGDLSRWQ